MKRLLFFLLKSCVSLGLLILVLTRVDGQEYIAVINSSRLDLLLAAFSLSLVILILSALRWYLLLRVKSEHPVNFWSVLHLSLVGIFFNTYVPSGFVGDLVRGHRARQYHLSGSEAFGSMIIDRFLGLMSLIIIAMFGALLSWSTAITFRWQQSLFYLYVAGLGCFFVLVSSPVRNWVQHWSFSANLLITKVFDLYIVIATYPRYLAFWSALGISLMAMMIMVGVNFIIAMAFNLSVEFSDLLWLVPTVGILSTVPISLSGWGVREAGYAFFLGQVAVPAAQATMLSMAFGGVILLLGALGGLWYLATLLFSNLNPAPLPSNFSLPRTSDGQT